MQKPLITLAKDRDFAAGFHFKLVHTINLLSLIGQNWWTKGLGAHVWHKNPESYQCSQQMGLETARSTHHNWEIQQNFRGDIDKQPASLNFPTFAFGGACNFSFWAWIVVDLMVLIGDGILPSLTFNLKNSIQENNIQKLQDCDSKSGFQRMNISVEMTVLELQMTCCRYISWQDCSFQVPFFNQTGKPIDHTWICPQEKLPKRWYSWQSFKSYKNDSSIKFCPQHAAPESPPPLLLSPTQRTFERRMKTLLRS